MNSTDLTQKEGQIWRETSDFKKATRVPTAMTSRIDLAHPNPNLRNRFNEKLPPRPERNATERPESRKRERSPEREKPREPKERKATRGKEGDMEKSQT
jgi:hypothetical protein